jgi:hypothetical protein
MADQQHTLTLSDDAFLILCGLIQPSDSGIYSPGIFSDAWDELRTAFPESEFRARVPEVDEFGDPPVDEEGNEASTYYNPDAGE